MMSVCKCFVIGDVDDLVYVLFFDDEECVEFVSLFRSCSCHVCVLVVVFFSSVLY